MSVAHQWGDAGWSTCLTNTRTPHACHKIVVLQYYIYYYKYSSKIVVLQYYFYYYTKAYHTDSPLADTLLTHCCDTLLTQHLGEIELGAPQCETQVGGAPPGAGGAHWPVSPAALRTPASLLRARALPGAAARQWCARDAPDS